MKKDSLIDLLDGLFPRKFAAQYDNPGKNLWINGGDEITGVCLAVDMSPSALAIAKESKCNLIITHHPFIFNGVKNITGYIGRMLSDLASSSIDLYSIHTNADASMVSYSMARDMLSVFSPKYCSPLVSLKEKMVDIETRKLVRSNSIEEKIVKDIRVEDSVTLFHKKEENELHYITSHLSRDTVMGAIYSIGEKCTLYDLISVIDKQCNEMSFYMLAKSQTEPVNKVGVIGGSGGSTLNRLLPDLDCKIFITSDIKHNDQLTLKYEHDINLVLIPHDLGERFWLKDLSKIINTICALPIVLVP